jgi:hypothetical protein
MCTFQLIHRSSSWVLIIKSFFFMNNVVRGTTVQFLLFHHFFVGWECCRQSAYLRNNSGSVHFENAWKKVLEKKKNVLTLKKTFFFFDNVEINFIWSQNVADFTGWIEIWKSRCRNKIVNLKGSGTLLPLHFQWNSSLILERHRLRSLKGWNLHRKFRHLERTWRVRLHWWGSK